MRKHFLILMLFALLPYVGWAQTRDVKVWAQGIEKTYGSADPAITAADIYCEATDGNGLTDQNLDDIAAVLSIVRIQNGEDVNDNGYSYRLTKSANPAGFRVYVQTTDAYIYINPLNLGGLGANDLAYNEVNVMYKNGNTQLKPQQDDFTVTISNLDVASLNGQLTYGTDYTISTAANAYGENNDVPTGTVKIVGSGNFTGTATLTFPIRGASISGGTISYIGNALTFNGQPQEPTVANFKLTLNGEELAATGNWQIKENAYENGTATYKDNLHAGKGKVTIEGINSYSGEIEAEFNIAQYTVPANGLTVTKTNPDYNGKAQLPNITSVIVTGTTLALNADNDYEVVSTSDNINAGNYNNTSIRFKQGGDFKGSVQALPYTINKKSMAAIYKNVETDDITYTGSAITPNYTLKVANEEDAYELVLNKDFTIEEANNTNANNAASIKFIAKANSNFTGETDAVVYTIDPAHLTVTPQDIFASYGSSINPTSIITGWKTADDEAAGYTGEIAYTFTNAADNTDVYDGGATPTAIGEYNITLDFTALNADNYDFNADPNKPAATLVISAGEIVLHVISQTNLKYGDNAANYTLAYDSGLSDADAAVFDGTHVTNVAYKVFNAQNEDVTPAAGATKVSELDAASYKIKAVPADGVSPFGYLDNYNVIIADGTLTINKRPLSENVVTVAVNGGAALPYTSYTYGTEGHEVVYTVKLNNNDVPNAENANYTVEWVRSKNATKDEEDKAVALYPNTVSGYAAKRLAYLKEHSAKLVVTATANGNFTGSKEEVFSISKADLDVTGNDAEWTYGDAEATVSANWMSTIDKADLKDNDKGFKPEVAGDWSTYLFTGSLKAKRTAATGTSVGEYYDDTPNNVDDKVGLYPYDIKATNYNIIAHVGKLTISKGSIVLKVKDYNEKYGNAYDSDNFELEYVSGLTDPAKIDGWAALVDQTGVIYTAIDPADDETVIQDVDVPTTVGSTVKLKATGATSTNYDITLQLGTYTVVKRPIALKLKDQQIDLGDDIERDNTTTNDIITLVNIAGNNFVAADGDNLNKLIEAGDIVVTLESGAELNATGLAQENVIRATIDHDNYVLDEENSVWGNLTVNEAPVLTISSTDVDVLDKIDEYNGASNITVKIEGRSLNLGKWNVMVLPFDVTPYEFTQVLGRYAIFNTLKSANTANNTVSFGLELSELKANEPFLVKPEVKANENATSVAVNDDLRMFTRRTIEYPANGAPVKDDVEGVKFCGAYKAFDLEVAEGTADADGFVDDGGEAGSKIMYLAGGAFVTATNTAKTKSLKTLPVAFTRGYLDFTESGMSNARIFVEEADGTTTAINGISADGTLIEADGWYSVNGVKLQNAPVEKGVYIHNGKKVVVK